MTNADVIRGMTDEQLDHFLACWELGDVDYAITFCDLCKKGRRMICENCGQEMDFIEIDDFQRDGSDEWCSYPIYDHENGFYIDATENWTGYGMSDEEMAESIRCPLCKKFPFKCKEVQTYDLIRLVMFKEKER